MDARHVSAEPADRLGARQPPAEAARAPAEPTVAALPGGARGHALSRAPRPAHLLRLQRLAGNAAVARGVVPGPLAVSVQRFSGTEHVAIGDTASKEKTGIRYTEDPKDELSFGEVVAMAGDYFGDRHEMVQLSGTPFGREQLAYARAKVTGSTPPAVSASAKKAADDRYYKLAAANKSHFSAGGTAQGDYESGHLLALVEAYKSGQQGDNTYFTDALQHEAFSGHYLTDLFSGGHVRTPRTALMEYYRTNFGNSVTVMKEFLRSYLVRRLNALNRSELENVPDSLIGSTVDDMLDEMAGSALESFSLGDLVSLAMHDYDNVQGVPVVSANGPDGTPVPGGFRWVAMGDNQVGSGGGSGNAAVTFEMASSAVKVSRTELDEAYLLGVRDCAKVVHPLDLNGVAVAAVNALAPFRALGFIPHEDTATTRPGAKSDMSDGPLGDWRWGSFSPEMRRAFEGSVTSEVVPKVSGAAANVPHPKEVLFGRIKINARQAVVDLARQLEKAPLTTFEELFGPAG